MTNEIAKWCVAVVAVATLPCVEAVARESQESASQAVEHAASALDLGQVQVRGEFGRRINQLVENDLLQVDVENAFLQQFRDRPAAPFPYLGCGKFLDAVVRLAAYSGDERLLSLKRRMIGELLATQDPGMKRGTVQLFRWSAPSG